MTSLFKNDEARRTIAGWFERFRARLPVATESRRVATRFGDTHVLIGGPTAAPPVVVLHGAMASSAHAMVELAPLFARFRVHAVDIIGQSVKSADARISVAGNDHGLWLGDVLDQLGLGRAHVVGSSWGGFVAIRLAACAPERIDRLALLVPAGVVGGLTWPALTRVALPMLMYQLFPSPRRLERCLRHLLTTSGDNDWTAYLGDAFRLYRLQTRVPALAQPAELAGFTRPTLVLGATRDLSFPGEPLLARARALFPGLAATELIDAAHSPPTTPEFRQWLGDRLGAFFLADEHDLSSSALGAPVTRQATPRMAHDQLPDHAQDR